MDDTSDASEIKRRIREQSIDQRALEGAMDDTSD